MKNFRLDSFAKLCTSALMPFLLTAAFPCLDDFVLFGVLTVNYTIKIKRIQKKKEEEKNRARPNAEDRTRRWDLSQS